MRKLGLVAFGALSGLASWASFVYFAGWLTNSVFPKTVDSGPAGAPLASFVIDTLLLLAFCAAHSLLARTSLKTLMRRVIPRNLERASYCMLFGLLMIGLGLAWRPLPAVVWRVEAPAAVAVVWTLFAASWVIHFGAIFWMGYSEFFGLRQIGLALRGEPYSPPPPADERAYLWSHLLLVVGLTLIPWFTPTMSVGHLYFCVFTSVYNVVGAWLSHRDFGDMPAPVLA